MMTAQPGTSTMARRSARCTYDSEGAFTVSFRFFIE
jgi:hypothetical protein